MKAIVTGAAGRLGQCTVRELLEHGFDVVALDTARPAADLCPFVAADLADFNGAEKLGEIFSGSGVVGIVHLARKRFPYTESGFDAASGAWKTPDVFGDARRFNHNAAITHNVLSAAVAAGVKTIVSGSSLAVYGLFYSSNGAAPDYLPVNEEHPRRPADPYGLSKLVGEEMCDAFSRRTGARIASLRFSGIYAAENAHVLAERRQNPMSRGAGALWSYVDVRDAAAACRLALAADFSGHQAFNICAPTTIMDEPTEELVRRYLPRVEKVNRAGKNWSGYDTRKAEAVLGFEARHLFYQGILQ